MINMDIHHYLKKIKRTLYYMYMISPKYFIINLVFTILIGMTPALSILATKTLINGIVVGNNIEKSNNLIYSLFIYAFINIIIQLIHSTHQYLNAKYQVNIDYKMNMDILDKCNNLSLENFEQSETYNLLGKAEMEGQTKVYLTFRNVLSILTQAISMISVFLILISWNAYLLLLVLATPIVSTIINIKIGYKNYLIRMERMDELRKSSYLKYLLTNDIACKEIKTYNIGTYLISIFSNLKRKMQDQDLEMIKIRTKWSFKLNIIEEILNLFIIFRVVILTSTGKILIGNTVAYIDSLNTIQANIGGFLLNLSDIYNDILYVEHYFNFLDLKINNSKDKLVEIDEIKSIEFKNVYFQYNDMNNYTLSNINLKISNGELLGIVGENGSGKTTFIKLLCGFYNYYQGEILINGINLKEINTSSLREKMGVIFQDFNKYEMTLRENIGFGNINEIENDEQILQVLEEINLRSKVDKYDKQLDTQMGKWFGGQELSKGQWQRIALARAFIRNADIYILDEPTSSLDPISEKEIFDLVRKRSENKIGVFITHRIESIPKFHSRIIVFSEGTIVGDGKHEDLIDNCFVYERLLESAI